MRDGPGAGELSRQPRAAAWLTAAWLAAVAALALAGCAAGTAPARTTGATVPAAAGRQPGSAAAGRQPGSAAAGRQPGAPAAARPRTAAGERAAAGAGTARSDTSAATPPRYFADLAMLDIWSPQPLEVRDSASGTLVARDRHVRAIEVAALAGGRTFVIAQQVRNLCATRLYRIRLNGGGQPGRASPLHVGVLHGLVSALAASADGHVVGYAFGGCVKGTRGYIGVTHVLSGQTRRWSGLNLGGVTTGNVGLDGPLSISADGRLMAFPAFRLAAGGLITGQGVRLLPVGARAGSVAQRSRIVHGAPYPPYRPLLAAAVLSPHGRTLYVCEAHGQGVRDGRAMRISGYLASSGKPLGTLATLVPGGSAGHAPGYCPMALDPRGRYLLVPYSVRKDHDGTSLILSIARVSVPAGRVSVLRIRMPGGEHGLAEIPIAW